jgi:hypothetical protein
MPEAKCIEDACAWWIVGEKRPGGCCIPRIAHYLAALVKEAGLLTAAVTRTGEQVEDAAVSVRDRRR